MADFNDTFDLEVKSENNNLQVEVTNARLRPGSVTPTSGGGLLVDVEGFEWELDGLKGVYAGALSQAVVSNDTHYIYLDNAGVLQNNLTGFPLNTVTHIKLAEVNTNASGVESVLDRRQFLTSSASILAATVSLDDAYNEGRIITVDAGPVELDGHTTQAPFRIVPKISSPSVNLQDGQMQMFTLPGGKPRLCVYDSSRGDWLGMGEMAAIFATNGNVDNAYLRVGQMVGANSGFRVMYNCTLVGVSVDTNGGNNTKGFEIRKNGVATSLYSWNNTAGQYIDNALNVQLTAGDSLQVFAVAAGLAVNDPVVVIYLSWRF